MLSIEKLSAGYGNARVLHGLDLHVNEAEIVSILGPNGAGKSTTLKAVSGLIPARSGSISFAGRPLARLKPEQRARLGLGYVPEGRGILGRLTVEENLRLGLAARRERRPWQQDVADVLEVFPALSDRMPERAASLSGGQQQMLAIGRALVARPRLLMIDELSFGLAPVITQQIMDAIELLRQRGQTFLLVEQDASVLRASDRTYVLAGGAVALQDRSENLLSHGRDRLATVYLGERSSM